MTTAVLNAYMTGHATGIGSEAYASRATVLMVEYLIARKAVDAPVSYWLPSKQLDFARYLHEKYSHAASTIERTFNVIRSAFIDATKVKMRVDLFGSDVEGALMSHSPTIVMNKARISRELKIAEDETPTFVPTLEEMAKLIDALESRHLRRWVALALGTWARPEAITDFDPATQWDRRTGLISLNPRGRAQTNKRRARIPCPRMLASSIDAWMAEDAVDGLTYIVPEPWTPMFYNAKRVGSVKKAIKRIADDAGLPDITQKTMRTFMATMVRKLCPGVPREKRSIWLGHVVKEGSRTTDHYEIEDADYLEIVALATDYVLQQISDRCKTKPFAIEVRLNRQELARLGASKVIRSKP